MPTTVLPTTTAPELSSAAKLLGTEQTSDSKSKLLQYIQIWKLVIL